MHTSNGRIVLEDSVGFLPSVDGVSYTDITGTKIHIPMKLLVRLYEGSKFHLEREGLDWERFTNSLFK